MTKFGCFLFALILLFSHQVSTVATVSCPYGSFNFDIQKDSITPLSSGTKDCSACAVYHCQKISASGCPEDFYHDCSFRNDDIEFIQSKTPNSMNYFNDYTGVVYISGCLHEIDTSQCLNNKITSFQYDISTKKGTSEKIWNGNDEKPVDAPENLPYNKNDPSLHHKYGNNSNDQNFGAFKFIGIITIRLVLVAWI